MKSDKTAAVKEGTSEREFTALCRLIQEENGRTLVLLSKEFGGLIRREPGWKRWIAGQGEFSGNARLRELLEETQWEETEESFRRLQGRGREGLDLEEALYQLSAFADPAADRAKDIALPLDRMGDELNVLLRKAENEDAALQAFRRYVFDLQGFQGNTANYYDPENSYLDKVLDRRTGIPISLSAVCLLLARRARWQDGPLPLAGIGLPSHFIVQFRFPDKAVFIDPFNRGRAMTRKNCVDLLSDHDIAFQDSYLLPVDDHAILCRTITNLLHIYTNMGDERKKNQLLKYLQALSREEE